MVSYFLLEVVKKKSLQLKNSRNIQDNSSVHLYKTLNKDKLSIKTKILIKKINKHKMIGYKKINTTLL